MRCTIPLTVIVSILLVLPACDEDSSPAGPDGGGSETVTLTVGSFRYGSAGFAPLQYHITGSDIDTTLVMSMYTLSGVPAGIYTVSCSVVEPYNQEVTVVPASRTVTAVSGILEVDPFLIISNADMASLEENGLGIVYGRISCIDMVRDDFRIALTTVEGEILDRTSVSSRSSTYYFLDIPYGTYHVIPTLPMFDFDPPNRTVTLDDIFTVANIAATYTGPELHTISVRIVSDVQDFRGYLYVYVYLPDEIMPLIKRFQQDETGYTVTSPLMPGEYMVEIVGFTHGSHNPSEWEGLTPIPLILLDHDVYLGEITMRYIGPMYYRVSGTVIDAAGNGIEGVTITMNNTVAPRQYGNVTRTGDAGAYLFSGSQYKTREDLDLTLTAAKTGWVFEPPSINLTQAYDRTLSRVEFTADFTAAPIESP